MRCAVILLVSGLVGLLGAAEPSATAPTTAPALDLTTPVVVVGGQPITLRDLEDALLKREGTDLVEELVHGQLEATDWSKLADDDVLVEVNGVRLRRALIAAQLLRQKAAAVREELINIAIVQQALDHERVTIGEPEIQAEVARMQRQLDRTLAEKAAGTRMSLDDYIRQSQKTSLSEFTKQPGFRMGAGLHILAERRLVAEIDDEAAKAWFAAHRAAYDVSEGVDLSLIDIPYQQTKGPDGAIIVTAAEQKRVNDVVTQVRQSIVGGVAFAKSWQFFGSGRDAQAGNDGHIGWVGRDGVRAQKGARVVPAGVLDAAFAASGTYPILLQPIAYDGGVALALVHGRRVASTAEFAVVRARVVSDMIDAGLEARLKQLLGELRAESTVDYESLPPLIDARARAAGIADEPAAKPVPGEESPAR